MLQVLLLEFCVARTNIISVIVGVLCCQLLIFPIFVDFHHLVPYHVVLNYVTADFAEVFT